MFRKLDEHSVKPLQIPRQAFDLPEFRKVQQLPQLVVHLDAALVAFVEEVMVELAAVRVQVGEDDHLFLVDVLDDLEQSLVQRAHVVEPVAFQRALVVLALDDRERVPCVVHRFEKLFLHEFVHSRNTLPILVRSS